MKSVGDRDLLIFLMKKMKISWLKLLKTSSRNMK